MRVGIIGLGNLGTAIGNLITANGFNVIGWEHNREVAEEINNQHTNTQYLPGIELDSKLTATTDLSMMMQSCQIIFITIPSVFVKPVLQSQRDTVHHHTTLVNLAKGIDKETGLTSFQTISVLFPQNPKVMLSGPSIANEFSRRMPTVVVIAGKNRNDLLKVSHILDNDYFRVRFSEDEVGVELGGILKNIYAIGLGLFDGRGITSIDFRAVYLTIALEEITRIGIGMGARLETFLYLSGIGDLLATSLSEHSHNRRLGELLAQGLSLSEIKNKMGVFPEGYNTLKVILYIAEKLHIAMPLAKGLWDVAHGRYAAENFITDFIKDFVE